MTINMRVFISKTFNLVYQKNNRKRDIAKMNTGSIFLIPLLCIFCQLNAAPIDILNDKSTERSLGGYILPNEFNPQNFRGILAGKQGVYIGVGTFRALSAIGMGNFDHAILLDFDQTVVSFNKKNIEVIAESLNRSEYLSILFNLNLDQARLNEVDVSPNNAEKVLNSQLQRDSFKNDMPGSLSHKHLVSLRKGFFSKMQWQATIFGSDVIFEKVKQMILRGDVSIGCADLIDGKTAFPSISAELKQRGMKVSVIDLSNVIAHTVPTPYSSEKKETWRRLEKNLAMLPSTEDALVLTTDAYTTPRNRRWASWGYSSLTLSALLSAISKPNVDDAIKDLEIISNDAGTNKTLVCESLMQRILPVSFRTRYFF